MAKAYKKHGRLGDQGHWTQMLRTTMETDAWRALRPTAQALYPWLKLNWKGPKNNNNGQIQFSARQAAKAMGVSLNTAASAFLDLQAKGFIRVTAIAELGTEGQGKATSYEITELAYSRNVNENNLGPKIIASKLYLQWQPGKDFLVQKARENNPTGIKNTKPRGPQKFKPLLKNCDGIDLFESQFVSIFKTSLSYHTYGAKDA